ncbi:MAG: RHS repeat-associated core domain-containing protein [Bacteroidales bacterium]|nr:RHS repeat-associated core domain-containing protein [Bacteroidales bacterium]
MEENARGQLTRVSRGGKETAYGFDDRGMPTSIQSTNVVGLFYSFDSKGNLEHRTDTLTSQREQFQYDDHNRLTKWDVWRNDTLARKDSITYDVNTGNITQKSSLDNMTMNYGGSGKPLHALTSISGKPSAIPFDTLNVTYTDFKKISTLTEGNKYYTLSYGVDDQRRKSIYQIDGVTRQTRYYLGNYEEEIDAAGNIRKIHYLSGGAVYIQNNNADSLLYGYSDNQGSLIALTDESGNVLESYAYDPWGQRRNPNNWTEKDTRTSWRLNRGYTGHEHLDAFGIINMNGRVYDPLTGMFFSPDPYIQAPDSWLNYNRYSYCIGNPLKYTDPDGELFIIDDWIIGGIKGLFNGEGFWKSANRHAGNAAKIWGGVVCF